MYDGDTFTLIAHCGPDEKRLYKWRVRIRGCDCPELTGTTKMERRCAIIARERLRGLIEGMVVKLDTVGYGECQRSDGTGTILPNPLSQPVSLIADKYGRVLGSVEVGNTDLAILLIREGLAVPYDGKKKQHKTDWKERCKAVKVTRAVELKIEEHEAKRKSSKSKTSTTKNKKKNDKKGPWGAFFS